jgi:hypothetical protein
MEGSATALSLLIASAVAQHIAYFAITITQQFSLQIFFNDSYHLTS